MGVLSFIGNWAQFRASTTAPNAGLAIAVVSLQSAVIALLAFIFFKEKINIMQIIGMVTALIGIVLISLGSS